MEAVALFDFDAKTTDDVGFKKGMVLKIVDMCSDKHWYKAEVDGAYGLVPENYIEMKPHDWYKEGITRAVAEEVLSKQEQIGAFMIRMSESSPGEFSLSVKTCDNNVEHFKILRDSAGKYFLWAFQFNSMNELVNYHRTSSVSMEKTIYLKDMIELVEAAFNFTAVEEGELDLQKGDKIEVTNTGKSDPHWWTGKNIRTKQLGLFPANYVKTN